MSAVWVCGACAALHQKGEDACRRCGAARAAPGAALVPRGAESEPVLLHLPPIDFPYSRTPRMRGRVASWITPIVLVGLAVSLAVGWDPFVRRFAAARALGGDSPAAEAARRVELGFAAARLEVLLAEREAAVEAPEALPPDWLDRVRPLANRYHLDGDAGSPTLGPLEVAMRGVWLELVSLPPDAPPAEAQARIQTTKEELSRVTEDLSHAR